MDTPIDLAISTLEAEVLRLGAPEPGRPLWLVLQAKSLALSALRAIRARGIAADPQLVEQYRRDCRRLFVAELGSEDGT